MANKYLALNAGIPTETEATTTSAGAGDAGKVVALDAAGKLDSTMMPTGLGADISVIAASENLSAGDFVSVWNDGGTPKVRKADASTAGKHAHGFVLSSVTSGANASVYHEGHNTGVTGATAGDVYLSATTAGGFTSTPPSGTGQVVQKLGVAVSATSINAEIGQQFILA